MSEANIIERLDAIQRQLNRLECLASSHDWRERPWPCCGWAVQSHCLRCGIVSLDYQGQLAHREKILREGPESACRPFHPEQLFEATKPATVEP